MPETDAITSEINGIRVYVSDVEKACRTEKQSSRGKKSISRWRGDTSKEKGLELDLGNRDVPHVISVWRTLTESVMVLSMYFSSYRPILKLSVSVS